MIRAGTVTGVTRVKYRGIAVADTAVSACKSVASAALNGEALKINVRCDAARLVLLWKLRVVSLNRPANTWRVATYGEAKLAFAGNSQSFFSEVNIATFTRCLINLFQSDLFSLAYPPGS